MTTAQLLYRMDEAGSMLGIARSTMYLVAERGDVQLVRIGRRRLVTADSLRAYVDRLTEAESASAPADQATELGSA